MKKITSGFLFMLLLFSCEKDPTDTKDLTTPGDDFKLKGDGKIKTMYIYSSSSKTEPYATNAYTYDEKWNLKKILISDYPKPVFASYTFEYSDEGMLLNKKYNAIEGANHPDQTEADFILIREYKYSYQGNKKIERIYIRGELTESVVYTFDKDLQVSESHNNFNYANKWSIMYQYDSKNNLIKTLENPEGTYTTYTYEGSRLIRSGYYDKNRELILEIEFVYSKSDDKVIVESHNRIGNNDFLSEKMTYKDGNVIEHIKYHPTMGGEWFCYRYDYY